MHPRERLDYSPIDRRPPLRFPEGIRSVVWPLIALEEWDLSRPMARMVISPPQGQPQLPDLPNWSWHEYGMRVGFWRLKKMLERLGISPTVTLNAKVWRPSAGDRDTRETTDAAGARGLCWRSGFGTRLIVLLVGDCGAALHVASMLWFDCGPPHRGKLKCESSSLARMALSGAQLHQPSSPMAIRFVVSFVT